jgi:hypothetical protein
MGFYEEERERTIEERKKKAALIRRIVFRAGIPLFVLFVLLCTLPFTIGINDAGQRTVVQWPNGKLFVKFTPGMYVQAFGSTTEYNDFITFDFDRTQAEGGATTLDQAGISVRYQDGGMGTVFGKARFGLPSDEKTMLDLHKAFRSNSGLANKLIKPVTEEAMNLTAGLMRSEEAYATKRAIFTQLAKSQVNKGKFQTKLETTSIKDEATGKTIWKEVPVIDLNENKQPIHLSSDLVEFGITLAGFQLNDPGFEPSTMKQISDKRDATMAIITAKANAERAKQEAVTAEEKGKANVMTAKYEQEVEKEKAIVMAQREKEVATIKAKQKVEVAKQAKLEAIAMKERAGEIKQEQILLGEGEAERKRLVMEADGALAQKLEALVTINRAYANALGQNRLVPDIQFGNGGNDENSNGATDLINMLMVKTAKDLSVDATVQ